MKFRCYLIDDKEEKHQVLPRFLNWLNNAFSNQHTFIDGFNGNLKKAPRCEKLLIKALEDEFSLILLDANLDSEKMRSVAQKIIDHYQLDSSDVERTAKELTDKPNEVKLGAAVYLAAKKKNCRLAWISNFDVDLAVKIGNLDNNSPNLPWSPNAINQWREKDKNILSTLLRAFHPDPHVQSAVEFAFQPPKIDQRQDKWDHDSLEPNRLHSEALRKFLDTSELNESSAKALLCESKEWPRSWETHKASSPSRCIDVDTLQASCRKLGIEIEVPSSPSLSPLPVPCQPFLPFLTSLRAVVYQMKQCSKFHPPHKIVITAENNECKLRLELEPYRKDEGNTKVNMAAFEKAFNSASNRLEGEGGRMTTKRLVDLTYARTEITPSTKSGKFALFAGTDTPVVDVTFDDNQSNPAIIISWPPNP